MIYVVRGSAGEYSNQSHWLVAAFEVREHADAFAKRLSERSDAIAVEKHAWYLARSEQRRADPTAELGPLLDFHKNPDDPEDEGDSIYEVAELSLFDALPEIAR